MSRRTDAALVTQVALALMRVQTLGYSDLRLTERELVEEARRLVTPCPACNGSRYADYAAVPCETCDGTGVAR